MKRYPMSPVVYQRFGFLSFPHLSSPLVGYAKFQVAVEACSSGVISFTRKPPELEIFLTFHYYGHSFHCHFPYMVWHQSKLYFYLNLCPTPIEQRLS